MNIQDIIFPPYQAYDPEAERGILGLMLSGRLAEPLRENQFHMREHRLIYHTIARLRAAGQVVNLATVRAELSEHRALAKAGGGAALDGMVNNAPRVEDIPSYLKLLRLYVMRRNAAMVGWNIVRLSYMHKDGEHFPKQEMLELIDQFQPDGKTARAGPAPTGFSARALLEQARQGTPWLVKGLLIAGGVNLLAGEVAAGKTFLALDLALAVAGGEEGLAWDGRKCAHGPVLYYCLDSSPRTIQERLRGLCAGRGMAAPEDLWFEVAPLNLAEPGDTGGLRRAIQRRKTALVVLDVLARYMPGVDENLVATVGPVMTALRQLATSTGCSILALHHFNKNAGYAASNSQGLRVRGSTDILGAVDAALTVSLDRRPRRTPAMGENGKITGAYVPPRRILTPEKNREAPEEGPLEFEIEAGEGGEVRLKFRTAGTARQKDEGAGRWKAALEALLKVLGEAGGEPLTRAEIEARAGEMEPVNLNRMFAGLKRRSDIQVGQRGKEFTYWVGGMGE